MSDFLTTICVSPENSRFDSVTAARVFSDGNTGGSDFGGDGHFNGTAEIYA